MYPLVSKLYSIAVSYSLWALQKLSDFSLKLP
jgi:hypothetical protein